MQHIFNLLLSLYTVVSIGIIRRYIEYKNYYLKRFKGIEIFFRYKSSPNTQGAPDDLIPDYMNILGMIFSMCGLMMRVSVLRMQQLSYKFTINDCLPLNHNSMTTEYTSPVSSF